MGGNGTKNRVGRDDSMEIGGGTEAIQNLESSSVQQVGTEKKDCWKEALEILPELVWLMVFENVPFADLYACYQTCKAFQTLLERRRLYFLLPRVLHSILSLKKDVEINLYERRDLLNCRLVNSRWRQAVDEYCQTVSLMNDDDEAILPYSFSSSAEVDNFKAVMKGRPMPAKNPFISRNVEFSDEDLNEYEEGEVAGFWKSVADLLELHGGQIWYCNLTIEIPQPFALNHDIIQKLTGFMPNLKSLYVGGSMDDSESSISRRDSKALVADKPLPRLPNLVKLRVLCDDELIQRELLGSTCDPYKLEFLAYSANFKSCSRELLQLRNLKCLSLSDIETENSFTDLKNVEWPLTVVDLELGLMSKTMFPAMLEWLNKFAGTLRTVTLLVWGKFGVNRGKKALKLRLRLPHLEQFSLVARGCSGIMSIDFLLELEQLKFLTLDGDVALSADKSRNPTEIIRFAGMWDKMEESNIWQLLPKLKFLKIKQVRCSKKFKYRRELDGNIGKDMFKIEQPGWLLQDEELDDDDQISDH